MSVIEYFARERRSLDEQRGFSTTVWDGCQDKTAEAEGWDDIRDSELRYFESVIVAPEMRHAFALLSRAGLSDEQVIGFVRVSLWADRDYAEDYDRARAAADLAEKIARHAVRLAETLALAAGRDTFDLLPHGLFHLPELLALTEPFNSVMRVEIEELLGDAQPFAVPPRMTSVRAVIETLARLADDAPDPISRLPVSVAEALSSQKRGQPKRSRRKKSAALRRRERTRFIHMQYLRGFLTLLARDVGIVLTRDVRSAACILANYAFTYSAAREEERARAERGDTSDRSMGAPINDAPQVTAAAVLSVCRSLKIAPADESL